MSGHTQRLAEQIIKHVDAVRRDVVKRSAPSLLRIDEPVTLALRTVEPGMASEFSQHRFPDGSSFEQLLGALHLGIKTPIVRHAESFLSVLRSLKHRPRLGKIHRERLFSKHMPALTKRLEGLRRVQKYRRTNEAVLRFNRSVNASTRICERFLQRTPDACFQRRSLGRIARAPPVQLTSRFSLNAR